MSEMRERVARAIHQERYGGQIPWGRFPDAEEECRQEARAAIEAMREPTEAMMAAVDCGGEKADWLAGKAWKAGWQAMLDEALK
jgi:hypothetical protein